MCPLIGPALLDRRVRLGLSLQDAAHKTRISAPRLRALEQDDYASFGNSTYARSFLKLYSDFLNIDASQTLEWLMFNTPEPAPKRTQGADVTVLVDPPLAVGGGYALWRGDDERAVAAEAADKERSPAPAMLVIVVVMLSGLGLWLTALSQEWQVREMAKAQGREAAPKAALTQPQVVSNIQYLPPGNPEPRQMVAAARMRGGSAREN